MTTDLSIGEVAARTGMTQRTLRYYEDLGLLEPTRTNGGRRTYDAAALDRLYRIRLQRSLGTPVADVVPDDTDLLAITRRHLAGLDERLAATARERERVRSVEARLLSGAAPTDAELLDLLAGLGDEPVAVRRLTLLVYRDLEAMQRWLVDVFGFGVGPLHSNPTGSKVVHAEVYAGDGVIWMHQESPHHRLASPATTGSASHCMAIDVDDVEAHYARTKAARAEIAHEPMDMPYGVREYSVRDPEGGLWSFMQPLDSLEETDE
jgi:MerR family transcriptional regulator, thiopeptide resistance regulator